MGDRRLFRNLRDMEEAISLFKAILLAARLYKIEFKFLNDSWIVLTYDFVCDWRLL